jgi:molybdopterin-containing oxidoreductase family iron-sulfur binding subunit
MEKCTFCVQRIQEAKINHKAKNAGSGEVKVPDGTIKTACQQACPAEAIIFGNQADSESSVAKMKAQERDYSVLGFLDTRPHTTYLARVRNPNADMPDYTEHPYSALEYDKAVHGDHHDDHEEGGADHGKDQK